MTLRLQAGADAFRRAESGITSDSLVVQAAQLGFLLLLPGRSLIRMLQSRYRCGVPALTRYPSRGRLACCDDGLVAESVTVVWDWRPCGLVTLTDGKLVFPRVSSVAGVYRLTFQDDCGRQSGIYVGEADLLSRRFQHYRTPGVSQQTNLRLNSIMVNTLAAGGRIAVEIATSAQLIATDGSVAPLDLTWKAARVLVERAAEVAERTAGVLVLNK